MTFNFDPGMEKYLHAQESVGWIYLSITKPQWPQKSSQLAHG